MTSDFQVPMYSCFNLRGFKFLVCFIVFLRYLYISCSQIIKRHLAKLKEAMGFQRSHSSKQKLKSISKLKNNDENGGDIHGSINAKTTSDPPVSFVTSDPSYQTWMVGYH